MIVQNINIFENENQKIKVDSIRSCACCYVVQVLNISYFFESEANIREFQESLNNKINELFPFEKQQESSIEEDPESSEESIYNYDDQEFIYSQEYKILRDEEEANEELRIIELNSKQC